MSFKTSPISAGQLRNWAFDPDNAGVRLHRHDLNGPHHCDDDNCYCAPRLMSDAEILSHSIVELQQLLDSFHAVH